MSEPTENSSSESTKKPWLFKKGKSPNPGGRPKAIRELLDLAKVSMPKVFALATSYLDNEELDPRVRLDAAKFLASYAIGKPKDMETEEQSTGEAGPISPDLAAKLAALPEPH